MEMRRELRYRFDAPAVFSWAAADGRRFQGEGITRDISLKGAFILTATMPPPGCPVHVDLLLPSLTGERPMMRVTGMARVIRTEHPLSSISSHGFAVLTADLNQWGLITLDDDLDQALVGAATAYEN